MEHAPLRPVPTRPSGAVDPADAASHVAAALPGLDAPAATALSLVALVGRSRAETAETTGLDLDQLGVALARARKALRRSTFPLPGGGWCERAERLMSDRLDDALEAPGPARLEVHLRNCARCVEHERRLVQATDALVAAFAPTPEPAPAAAPALSVVKRTAAPAPAVLPFGEPVRPVPARVRPPAPPPLQAPPPRTAIAIAWTAVLVLVVILAVAAVAIAVAAALGASL
jgi:putative zinc finger protein